jgi:hypothetical protein
MKNKFLRYAVAVLPLVAVNAICLADGYFVKDDLQINLTVMLLFTIISALITVTKLFFDFFVALVALKSTGQALGGGAVLDRLIRNMGVQWIVTAAGLLLTHLIFPAITARIDLIVFAIAHTVYYILVARGFHKDTGSKVLYYILYGSAAALCWGYVICNLLQFAAM